MEIFSSIVGKCCIAKSLLFGQRMWTPTTFIQRARSNVITSMLEQCTAKHSNKSGLKGMGKKEEALWVQGLSKKHNSSRIGLESWRIRIKVLPHPQQHIGSLCTSHSIQPNLITGSWGVLSKGRSFQEVALSFWRMNGWMDGRIGWMDGWMDEISLKPYCPCGKPFDRSLSYFLSDALWCRALWVRLRVCWSWTGNKFK